MTQKVHPLVAGKKPPKRKPHRKLIFLGGFANVGKDTVYQLLKEVSPAPVIRVALADALKTEVYPILGKEYDPEDDDRAWKDAHRQEIIQYGESQKQEHGMFYWLKTALDEVLNKTYDRLVDYPHIVVTDVRRTEEFMWFKYFSARRFEEMTEAYKTYDTVSVAVHRPGAESDKDYLTHVALNYATETRMFTTAIKNDSDLSDLKERVTNMYALFIK